MRFTKLHRIKVKGDKTVNISTQHKVGLFFIAIIGLTVLICYVLSASADTTEPQKTPEMPKYEQIEPIEEEVPQDNRIFLASGYASHYGLESCVGSCHTASGEILDPSADTTAVPPQWIGTIVEFGDILEIISKTTGRSVRVKVNDTGGFNDPAYNVNGIPRVVDLNTNSMEKITDGGLDEVEVYKIELQSENY